MTDFSPYTPKSETAFGTTRGQAASPALSPVFTKHRTVADAVDSVTSVAKGDGMNMAGYYSAIIQVVPKAGTPEPDIEVMQWSEDAASFVSFATAKTASAPAANTPYTYECTVMDSIIWVKVGGTIAASDAVDIFIAGAGLDRDR